MTIVANIPTSQTTTIEDVMNMGVCAECRKPIAGHIKPDSNDPETKVWVGCANATDELPQSGPHPLRRSTDVVIMVPLTILQDALTAAFLPSHAARPEAPVEREHGRRASAARATRTPRTAAKGGTRYPTRGKPAGRYVAVPSNPPKKMTESINRVWFAMKNTKRGIVAKELAGRLGMADGTMAWVLNQLQKDGAIVHVRPGEHAPAETKKVGESAKQ